MVSIFTMEYCCSPLDICGVMDLLVMVLNLEVVKCINVESTFATQVTT